MSYFLDQANNLMRELNNGITAEDIAAALQCLYSAGVVDAGNYTLEQKMEMLQNIKKVYSIQDDS